MVNRRSILKGAVVGSGLLTFPQLWIPRANAALHKIDPSKPIKIGVVYSQTGFMGVVEKEQYKVAMMVIDQINAAGGVQGAKLEPYVKDPASDWPAYAKGASELLDEGVNIFWGCYTSASRESILPVIQKGGGLLFYPTYYEGRECTENMIMTGSCPNQQVDNSVPFMFKKYGKKVYLIGSNYIYPRTMNRQVKHQVKKHGGSIVGEKYVDLSMTDKAGFDEIIKDIKQQKPDWVCSNVVGGSSVAFMQRYKELGLNPSNIPIMSYPLTEPEVAGTGVEYCEGHFSSFTYFQSVDRPENKAFVKQYVDYVKSKPEWAGEPAVTSGVMQASYVGMQACIKAMNESGSAHPADIVQACRGMKIAAPEADIMIDSENLHTHLRPRIGVVNAQGQFDILEENSGLVQPEVFSEALDPGKSCKEGGQYFIRNKKVPVKRGNRKIVPQ